jgi:hypothetical protein
LGLLMRHIAQASTPACQRKNAKKSVQKRAKHTR